jgi:hypothetical protein
VRIGPITTSSGKASDSARSLAFAGVAIVWLFKNSGPDQPIPTVLIAPLAVFALALALDLFHYAVSAALWGGFTRLKERALRTDAKQDPELDAPFYLNWPGLVLFWTKLTAVAFG